MIWLRKGAAVKAFDNKCAAQQYVTEHKIADEIIHSSEPVCMFFYVNHHGDRIHDREMINSIIINIITTHCGEYTADQMILCQINENNDYYHCPNLYFENVTMMNEFVIQLFSHSEHWLRNMLSFHGIKTGDYKRRHSVCRTDDGECIFKHFAVPPESRTFFPHSAASKGYASCNSPFTTDTFEIESRRSSFTFMYKKTYPVFDDPDHDFTHVLYSPPTQQGPPGMHDIRYQELMALLKAAKNYTHHDIFIATSDCDQILRQFDEAQIIDTSTDHALKSSILQFETSSNVIVISNIMCLLQKNYQHNEIMKRIRDIIPDGGVCIYINEFITSDIVAAFHRPDSKLTTAHCDYNNLVIKRIIEIAGRYELIAKLSQCIDSEKRFAIVIDECTRDYINFCLKYIYKHLTKCAGDDVSFISPIIVTSLSDVHRIKNCKTIIAIIPQNVTLSNTIMCILHKLRSMRDIFVYVMAANDEITEKYGDVNQNPVVLAQKMLSSIQCDTFSHVQQMLNYYGMYITSPDLTHDNLHGDEDDAYYEYFRFIGMPTIEWKHVNIAIDICGGHESCSNDYNDISLVRKSKSRELYGIDVKDLSTYIRHCHNFSEFNIYSNIARQIGMKLDKNIASEIPPQICKHHESLNNRLIKIGFERGIISTHYIMRTEYERAMNDDINAAGFIVDLTCTFGIKPVICDDIVLLTFVDDLYRIVGDKVEII